MNVLDIQQLKEKQAEREEIWASMEIAYRRGYSQAAAHLAEELDIPWLNQWVEELYQWRYEASMDLDPDMTPPPAPKRKNIDG